MKASVLAAALAFSGVIFSGCVAHHSVKGYQSAGSSSGAQSRISIRIDSHSYKQGGLFVDNRAPFTVEISTHDARIETLRIDALEVTLGAQKQSLLDQKPMVIFRIPETREILSFESPRTFSFIPSRAGERLVVEVTGILKSPSTTTPFRIRQSFQYEERNEIWMLTFDDILSV